VVWSIEEGNDGSLWIGTSQGLDRFEPGTGRVAAHYPTVPVFVIEQDAEGFLWFGTWGAGLGRLDPQGEQLVFYQHDPDDPDSLGDGGVIAIVQDRNGRLWIGTFNGGLNRFDPETERFIHYRNDLDDPNTLSSNTVLAIHEDRDGILWIATGGGGLNRFDPTSGTFAAYREKDGLPNDTVYGILEDDPQVGAGGSNLWLSTNRGLSRFNPQTGEFRNYDVGDGLQSNEFNQNAYLKSRSGEMFFGGINGFNAFYPDQVQDNPNVPPVVLTSLTQGGEEVQLGTTVESARDLTLRWPRNFFEFEFAALNYAQPEENRYAYMLDGFDPRWIETGARRFGQYTNLPGGTYTLRVRGSNNDGLWNEDGRALKVTVVPPFWQTLWFRGGVALVLLLGIIGGYRLRIRSIEARSRELEAQVADRTRELAALNAVAAVVSRSLDLTEILDDALEMILRVTETEGGGVYLVNDGGGALSLATHRGFDSQLAGEIDGLRVGEGPCEQVVQSSEPLVLKDLAGQGCFRGLASEAGGFRSLVSVPLASKGNVLGALFAMTRDYRDFKDEDVELLTSIGQQMGVATENARLYEQARRLAVVEERQRLARDLHDSVTQALYGMTLYSEAAAAQLSRDNLAKVIEYVRLLQDTAYEALAEMRLLIYELRPPVLEEEGLVAALETRLQAVEGRAGLKTTFEVDLVDPLPGDIEAGLYWIAKEALNNTLKHAQARSVAVRLDQKPRGGLVSLQIEDDGVGFEPATVLKSGGLGLPAMRERAEALGGKLSIDSRPGEGTRLLVELYHDRSD
jgi:signal transduction histidine kinase